MLLVRSFVGLLNTFRRPVAPGMISKNPLKCYFRVRVKFKVWVRFRVRVGLLSGSG